MVEFPREHNKMLLLFLTSIDKNGETNLKIAQLKGHKHKKNCKLKFKFKRLDITKWKCKNKPQVEWNGGCDLLTYKCDENDVHERQSTTILSFNDIHTKLINNTNASI
jgi:hypothetical protein